MRALRDAENKSCPGETICLTDARRGECAGRASRSAGDPAEAIFERICHADAGRGGCKLYGTKPENTPEQFVELIEAVEYLRRRSAQGFDMPPLDELGALFMAAFDGADEAHNIVANEPKDAGGEGSQPAITADSPFAQAFPHLVRRAS